MPDTIGDRLRTERERQAIPQKVLAQRVGISAPGLSQIERNHVEPSAFHLKCLAQALGVSMDYFAGLTDTPRPL